MSSGGVFRIVPQRLLDELSGEFRALGTAEAYLRLPQQPPHGAKRVSHTGAASLHNFAACSRNT